MTPAWMRLADESAAPSPALLVFPDRIEENLRRMIALAGGPQRLRPHLKTHKLPQLIALQARLGITRCKAATIAEVEMALPAGRPADQAIEVTFAYDLNGIMRAEFRDLGTGQPLVIELRDEGAGRGSLNVAKVTLG